MQSALEPQTVLPQRREQWQKIQQQHTACKRVVVDDLTCRRVSCEEVDGDAGAGSGAEEEEEGEGEQLLEGVGRRRIRGRHAR